jgi:5-(carboxyamino)imidazole ribonucleotide synthase
MKDRPEQKLDQRIGVLGGGQLGRMLLPPALRMNLALGFLDPDANAPCRTAGAHFSQGDLLDYDTVYNFGRNYDLITVEIEHVNTEALRALAAEGRSVRPSPDILALVQDKLKQKEFYTARGIPTAPFAAVRNRADLLARVGADDGPESLNRLFPAVQKLRRAGYDGRGVQILPEFRPGDLAAWRSELKDAAFDAPSLIESRIDFEKEIAVIVSRDPSGRVASYPPVEMEFHPTANLVELLFAPAELDPALATRSTAIAEQIAEELSLEGLLAVELFVTKAGEILVNEIAPRPHNSGHHTIEACVTSQFEQHLRAILDLPPGSTELVRPAAMLNLLGTRGEGPAVYEGLEKILAVPGVHLHLYGKRISRPFRKMGHITITATSTPDPTRSGGSVDGHFEPTAAGVRRVAREIRGLIQIVGVSAADRTRK